MRLAHGRDDASHMSSGLRQNGARISPSEKKLAFDPGQPRVFFSAQAESDVLFVAVLRPDRDGSEVGERREWMRWMKWSNTLKERHFRFAKSRRLAGGPFTPSSHQVRGEVHLEFDSNFASGSLSTSIPDRSISFRVSFPHLSPFSIWSGGRWRFKKRLELARIFSSGKIGRSRPA